MNAPQKLLKPCAPPNRGGKEALKNLTRGRYPAGDPKRRGFTVGPPRPFAALAAGPTENVEVPPQRDGERPRDSAPADPGLGRGAGQDYDFDRELDFEALTQLAAEFGSQ